MFKNVTHSYVKHNCAKTTLKIYKNSDTFRYKKRNPCSNIASCNILWGNMPASFSVANRVGNVATRNPCGIKKIQVGGCLGLELPRILLPPSTPAIPIGLVRISFLQSKTATGKPSGNPLVVFSRFRQAEARERPERSPGKAACLTSRRDKPEGKGKTGKGKPECRPCVV